MRRLIPLLLLSLFITPDLAWSLSPDDEDDADMALLRARLRYSSGELEEALAWMDRARELIVLELVEQEPPLIAPGGESVEVAQSRSNTAQLLEILSYYGEYVYGSDLELDGQYELLVDYLTLLHRAESELPRPSEIDGHRISTWANGRVHRLGSLDISHWASGQIHRIGAYNISYWANGLPHRIGDIDFSYSGDSRVPHRVESVSIR